MARDKQELVVMELAAEDTDQRSLEEQIAALAHALWRERGCPEGSSKDDWFRAEKEIKASEKA
jgi:hypothetical protein